LNIKNNTDTLHSLTLVLWKNNVSYLPEIISCFTECGLLAWTIGMIYHIQKRNMCEDCRKTEGYYMVFVFPLHLSIN